MEDFLRRCCPGPQTRGAFGAVATPMLFVSPKFCSAQKNLFQSYDKNFNLSPIKMYFAPKPQNLATGRVLPKLRLQLEYFVLKSIRPRDVA